jgi:GNAT superfamily N-acetyltransferase
MMGRMTVTVRPVRPGDGGGMARAWTSAAEYYAGLDPAHFQLPSQSGQAESFEDWIGQARDGALLLAAELDGQLAGWLAARVEPPAGNAEFQLSRELSWPRLVIDALVVHRSAWRQGAGGALLSAAESWGRDRGARIARLDTYADSPVSVPFYQERMGYRRRAIIFQKRLA